MKLFGLNENKTWDGFGKFNNVPVNLDKVEKKPELSREEEDFYNKLNTKIITIEEDQILQNHWLSSYMQMGETFIVRPDKYIFGCSSDRVSFQELTIDLKNRLRAR